MVLTLLLLIAACSSEAEEEPREELEIGEDSAIMQVNPLTGLALTDGEPDNPVFVVKIDNTRPAAPQTSLDKADLVIEQTVEGGVTRLAALYWTTLPESMGHIRSTRATDIGIAQPVNGHIVASGGAGPTLQRIRAAKIPLHTEDDSAPGFSSDAGFRPYNRLLNLSVLAAGAQGPGPSGPYLSWAEPGTEPESVGTAVTSATVRFSNAHTTTWAFADGGWKRTNGFATPEFEADNLIVIEAPERAAGYTDPAGAPVPETYFAGTGDATIFQGGSVLEATWHKKELDSMIEFRDAEGEPLLVQPGRTWIELVNQGRGATSWQ